MRLEALELQALEDCNHLTDTNDTGISYVAHMLEMRLLTSRVYCNFCRNVLTKTEKLCNSMCIGTHQPCKSTYQLCILIDIALKSYINTGPNFKHKVYVMVMNNIDFEKIFPEFYEPEHDIDHKHYLIKFFIDEYINKKCSFVSKQKTIALQKRYVRNKLRKIAHFMGQ